MEKAKIITSLECYFLFSVSSSVLTSLICVQILRGGLGLGRTNGRVFSGPVSFFDTALFPGLINVLC